MTMMTDGRHTAGTATTTMPLRFKGRAGGQARARALITHFRILHFHPSPPPIANAGPHPFRLSVLKASPFYR